MVADGQDPPQAVLVRQRELSKYHIPTRQLYILKLIQELGEQATLSEIAKKVERKIDVISRQTVMMEKDGLIKEREPALKQTFKNRINRERFGTDKIQR